MPKKPLVDKHLNIQRKPVKGGWHFVTIPGISASAKDAQGLVRVKGSIDNFKIRQFNLLPSKTSDMILVLKSSLRKSINKKVGDIVHVKLFADKSKVDIPQEIIDSLTQSERAYRFFMTLTESNKKYYLDWINEAKRIETKVDRIVRMMKNLEEGRKFWDWPSRE